MTTTTKELTIFGNRRLRIEMKDGQPYICLKDICDEVGIKDTEGVLRRLRNTEQIINQPGMVITVDTQTETGIRSMAYVNEVGLYEVIGNSRKPLAKSLHRQIIMALPALRESNQDIQRITELEDRIAKLEIGGRHLLTTVPEISIRSQLNMIIRKFIARRTGSYSYPDAWNELYFQFYYRYHKDLKICAKNRKCEVLDYAEKEGLMESLLSLATYIFTET